MLTILFAITVCNFFDTTNIHSLTLFNSCYKITCFLHKQHANLNKKPVHFAGFCVAADVEVLVYYRSEIFRFAALLKTICRMKKQNTRNRQHNECKKKHNFRIHQNSVKKRNNRKTDTSYASYTFSNYLFPNPPVYYKMSSIISRLRIYR